MSMLDAELDNIPLEASRGISALLQGQLDAFPPTATIALTRDEAALALGLVNAIVESLELPVKPRTGPS